AYFWLPYKLVNSRKCSNFDRQFLRKKQTQMKRFLILGTLLLAVGHWPDAARAQGGHVDDIYYSSEDAKKDAERSKAYRTQNNSNRNEVAQESTDTYYSSDGEDAYQDDNASSNSGYSVDDDDYGYAARIQRFGYPSYRIGYYSPWYDPFYDPWYTPYWGRPGVSVTLGWGSAWG